MTDRQLTAKEAAFCRAYVANGHNGKEAAIAAGYAPGSAKVAASRLLTRPHIRAEVKRLEAEAFRRSDVVSKLITDVDPVIARQIGAETDVEIIAATTRAYVLALLRENMEICAGRKKRKSSIVKTIKGVTTVEEVEIYDPHPTAANQAAQLLLQAAEISGKATDPDADQDENAELHAALAGFKRP